VDGGPVILPLDNACFTIGITAVNCSAIKPNPNEPQSDKQTLTAGEHWQIALTLPVPFKRSPIVIVQSKVAGETEQCCFCQEPANYTELYAQHLVLTPVLDNVPCNYKTKSYWLNLAQAISLH